MKKPIVSVIVPVYNAEKYLRECLMSIQNQTLKDIEIICINDGSTDKSLEILQEFASKDNRFIIISQKNQGVNKTRSIGYKRATGEYVAWVDNDDVLDKTMYEKMHNASKMSSSDIVICNYNLYPHPINRKEVWYKPYSGTHDWRFIAKNTTLWNKIVKRKLLEELKLDELFLDMGESAYGIILASTNNICTIDETLYNYRVGHGSVSSSYNKIDWFITTVDSNKKKYNYAKKHNLPKDIQNYFFYSYLYYNLVLMSVAARNNRKNIYYNAKKIIKENKFFHKQFAEYFRHNFSFLKRIFFRSLIYPNYSIAKNITKMILR